ncbi:MAG: sulfotransferase family 2 domain-containing protein [Silicimonas sp.]|nr:sulfotransferase family 2 domain-containing protein [Silicimonas sp.]
MEIPNQRRQPVFFDLPEHRISVISTPKCASSSLLKLLGPLLREDVDRVRAPQRIWKSYSVGPRELWDLKPDRFIVATVRNPWARVVSHYKDKVVAQLHDRLEQYGFRKGMPFEDYLDLIDRDYDIIKDFHVKRQVDMLFSAAACCLTSFCAQNGLQKTRRSSPNW